MHICSECMSEHDVKDNKESFDSNTAKDSRPCSCCIVKTEQEDRPYCFSRLALESYWEKPKDRLRKPCVAAVKVSAPIVKKESYTSDNHVRHVKQEYVRQAYVRPAYVKQEYVKPEDVKQEYFKQEYVKPEDVKQEYIKQEYVKPEDVKQEYIKQEYVVKQEDVKQEYVKHEEFDRGDFVKVEPVSPPYTSFYSAIASPVRHIVVKEEPDCAVESSTISRQHIHQQHSLPQSHLKVKVEVDEDGELIKTEGASALPLSIPSSFEMQPWIDIDIEENEDSRKAQQLIENWDYMVQQMCVSRIRFYAEYRLLNREVRKHEALVMAVRREVAEQRMRLAISQAAVRETEAYLKEKDLSIRDDGMDL
ncbi:hypothetical protein T4E_12303 [Trichinella pseudospiralis]|uniref:Uncharacterized protein n=1 Tax=Trichinella pseudospiralis TaxID=6337 RepID=A0A0V0XGX7_TRIPS|nr:hypothetical protein T4E_12303 [Trichinella pseudospiralis]